MKIWFITGTSRGFGRDWTEAALERGDKVAATARNTDTLQDLAERFGDSILPLKLDVANRDDCFAAVKAAHAHFGCLDVVVNNAGYGQFGMVEEISEDEARRQMETNFFGALWVTQAALPYLRAQSGGHILQVSSIGGVAAFPNLSMYHASKWALEGFSESLSQEVAEFGIHVTLIEPGPFGTDWSGPSAAHATPMAAYDGARERRAASRSGWKSGDPKATSAAVFAVVDAENPPLRLLLGEFAANFVAPLYAKRLEVWAEWKEISRAADGE
jgi:NAD(P)-dependent dehydrogenase (short-subunit alcohol dehydrogenase family)